MKNPEPTRTSRHSHSRTLPVRFEYQNTGARSVSVAGSFNHWRPDGDAMVTAGGGHWQCETRMPAGTYEYRLVVDGHWLADPLVAETIPNPYGGLNSILKVGEGAAAGHLPDESNTPDQ